MAADIDEGNLYLAGVYPEGSPTHPSHRERSRSQLRFR